MAKKMTKRDYFTILRAIPAVQENPDLVGFIDRELELLAKKNSAEKKPTAQQKANMSIADAIVDFMAAQPNRLFMINELVKEVPACADLTGQRVSAIVRGMIGDRVERIEEKRRAYFRYLPK